MSARSREKYRGSNPSRQCQVATCARLRVHTSRYCILHRQRVNLYGHPEGKAIRPAQLRGYRREFSAFLKAHGETPQVLAALQFLERLFNMGLPNGSQPVVRDVKRHFERLSNAGLTSGESLEISGAVWLLSEDQRSTLPDDLRLTYALGSVLLKARPIECRKVYSPTTGKIQRRYVVPNGSTRRLIGEAVRLRLGVFFKQVIAAREAEIVRQKEMTMVLALPFPSLPLQGLSNDDLH